MVILPLILFLSFFWKISRLIFVCLLLSFKAVFSVLSHNGENRKLWLVCVLCYYLHRSKPSRISQRCLLNSVNQDYQQDMSSGFVSHQLSQMVSHVYCVANQDSSVPHPWAYQIQALVASTSIHLSVSLSSILEAAFLRKESTFIQFYLWDLSSAGLIVVWVVVHHCSVDSDLFTVCSVRWFPWWPFA